MGVLLSRVCVVCAVQQYEQSEQHQLVRESAARIHGGQNHPTNARATARSEQGGGRSGGLKAERSSQGSVGAGRREDDGGGCQRSAADSRATAEELAGAAPLGLLRPGRGSGAEGGGAPLPFPRRGSCDGERSHGAMATKSRPWGEPFAFRKTEEGREQRKERERKRAAAGEEKERVRVWEEGGGWLCTREKVGWRGAGGCRGGAW